jgi:hypothetical protein
MRARQREAMDVVLDLPPRMLGHGWDVEDRGGGFYWRWMSPEPRAALVVPVLGEGNFTLSARIDALSVEQLDSLVVKVDGAQVAVKMVRIANADPNAHHQADIEFAAVVTPSGSQFLFIEFEIDRMHSPREVHGSEDDRMLGIGFGHLRMSRAQEPAPVAPEAEADSVQHFA